MKRAIDWSQEYEALTEASLRLAELIYENVMVLVPDDVWTQIVFFAQKTPMNCCSVLTRVSKQLHRVTHQNLTELKVKPLNWKLPVRCGISQYPGLTTIIVSGTRSSVGNVKLSPMKYLKKLVFTECHLSVNLGELDPNEFPVLDTIHIKNDLHVLWLKPNMCEKITELRVSNIYYGGLEKFPNLTTLLCYQTSEKIDFTEKLKRFGLQILTTSSIANLMRFNGVFVYKGTEYLIEDCFILNTKEDGSIEKIHLSDRRLPFRDDFDF